MSDKTGGGIKRIPYHAHEVFGFPPRHRRFVHSVGRAADSVVVFNEVNYHPSTNESVNEWIELHNQMAIDIGFVRRSLQGGVDFTFAEWDHHSGGGYVVWRVTRHAADGHRT
jgi:hypothetical protein